MYPQAGFERGIVILSIDPPADELAGLASDKVEISGLSKLRVLAGEDDELREALESLVSETVLDPDVVGRQKTEPGSPEGRLLVDDLQRSEPGKPGWREFERLCEHAIKHLFGREFSNLKAQLRTLDGLNRMGSHWPHSRRRVRATGCGSSAHRRDHGHHDPRLLPRNPSVARLGRRLGSWLACSR